MIGSLLYGAHVAIQWITASIRNRSKPNPYAAGQARFDRERDQVRADHGRVKDVEARRKAWLESALAGGRH